MAVPTDLIESEQRAKSENESKIIEKQNVIGQWQFMIATTNQEIAALQKRNSEIDRTIAILEAQVD